jgi:GTPase
VGFPNVGKSTLVNRLTESRATVVHETPGVTRDRNELVADWNGQRFRLIDTGGVDIADPSPITRSIAEQARTAIAEADLVLFVVDARAGVTPGDEELAGILRHAHKPVLLLANKIDDPDQDTLALEFHRLGLGDPVPVSAHHGHGTGDLLDAVVSMLPGAGPQEVGEDAIRVAILGRPNVGKSSLLNRLAGAELAIVDPAPGTTRDTVDSVVARDGRSYRLVDTAGMRRSFQQAEGADYYAFVRSLEAVDRADVALLVLEAPLGVAEQDQKVAVRAAEAGCGLVLLANKWDLMDDEARRQFGVDLERKLHFVDWAPLLRVSARTGRGVEKVWGLVDGVLEERARRIPTAALNQWLGQATARTPPPVRGRPVKLRYATQTRVGPPEVVLFTTGQLTPSYRRYLENDLRRTFGFQGTPLRLVVRVRSSQRPRGRERRP